MFHNTVQNTHTHNLCLSDNTKKKKKPWCLWIIWSFPSCDQQMTQFAMIVLLSAIYAGKPCPSCATSTRSSQWVQDLVISQPILWTKIINSAIVMMNKIFYYLSANMLVNELSYSHKRWSRTVEWCWPDFGVPRSFTRTHTIQYRAVSHITMLMSM